MSNLLEIFTSLIDCHVLLKYFELVFIQLQLVKFSCKLLII